MARWKAVLVTVAALVAAGLAVFHWRRPAPDLEDGIEPIVAGPAPASARDAASQSADADLVPDGGEDAGAGDASPRRAGKPVPRPRVGGPETAPLASLEEGGDASAQLPASDAGTREEPDEDLELAESPPMPSEARSWFGGGQKEQQAQAQERIHHVAKLVGALAARRADASGTATVRLQVARDGYVRTYDLVRSTGNATLDREVANVLRLAQPYPLWYGALELTVPFVLDPSVVLPDAG